MVSPLISIVIVTWNSEQWIETCLESLKQQSRQDFVVVVVDNHSQDRTGQLVEKFSVLVKQMTQNVGFCTAVNQGWARARGEFLLVLNPDVRLEAHCIEALIQAVRQSSSEVGMFAPKLMDYQGEKIDTAGLKLSFLRRFYDRGRGSLNPKSYNRPISILGPCGAAALYSRKMLETVNPKGVVFDPLFFAYGEDFDLCWRAQRAGFKALFIPSAVGYHVRGGSIVGREKKQYLSWRNRYFLLLKNETLIGFLLRFPLMIFYDLPRLIYFLFKNPYRWQALYELQTECPRLLRERFRIVS